MKKVISAQTIREAHRQGKRDIPAARDEVIITPEARTLASQLHITLMEKAKIQNGSESFQIDEQVIRRVVEKVYERLPAAREKPEEVKQAVIEALSAVL